MTRHTVVGSPDAGQSASFEADDAARMRELNARIEAEDYWAHRCRAPGCGESTYRGGARGLCKRCYMVRYDKSRRSHLKELKRGQP